ncbi:WXG100 family type VII secretion target [Pseudonocardia spinosispora]|uniref:WXG100 family type VII secretion target n=1 Tax=Pseudonocardia spinosispora TaxID=103441 RepID=UPI0004081B1C|nr:WXG100 family type VII secretion target [Pseudonocardia spinosispora]
MANVDDSPILVHQGMEDLAPQMLATADSLVAQLSDLERALQPVVETWTGTAATEYQMVHRKWSLAAHDLFGKDDAHGAGGVLGQIAKAVHINYVNYVDAEAANRKTWQQGA